ncbi:DUF418 domain-containing protein [Nibrella saemangeumensis]|uniref:DUF418 domain-containing protein n=1 Tax=Nibrella saemangeumensis TaxID=1084526 RepID=A0ABP8NQF5_9BACT
MDSTLHSSTLAATTDQAPQPVSRAERTQTIDIIRGFALLGILMMNIPGFGQPWTRWALIFGAPGSTDYYTAMAVETAFSGTMRTLFSMLFGAGMLLFLAKKEDLASGQSVVDYYYRRLLWLVLFGVINGYVLLWTGDILYFYGLCGLLLYPFRKMKATHLVIATVICVVLPFARGIQSNLEFRAKRTAYLEAVKVEQQQKKLTDEQKKAKEAWLEQIKWTKHDPKKEAEIIKGMQSGYGAVFAKLMPRNVNIESRGMYYDFWDMLGMMFLGMALFKIGFFSNKLSASLYWMTLSLGYSIGLLLGNIQFMDQAAMFHDPGAYVDTHFFSVFALYDLRRGATAIGHASLLLLVYRSGVVPWLMKALANVGQMAFTNYLMQSIICTLFFNGYGLGYYGKLAFHQLYYVVAVVWVFQIIFSVIWLQFFRFGPFEWLWRSLTYWKLQPMRLRTEPVAAEPQVTLS